MNPLTRARLFFDTVRYLIPVQIFGRVWFRTYRLDPVRLQRGGGFGRKEVRQIHTIIEDHRAQLLDAWSDYFGS
ncbi:MAG: DUF4160 domain-containing protein [Gammaproteobacteria bacterium]|nr:DUF4160 domain-containing protein [Gammaproteobacteria bacterium]